FLIWIPVFIRRTMDQVGQVEKTTSLHFKGFIDVFTSPQVGWMLAKNALLLIGVVLLYGVLLFATRQTLIVTSRKIEFDLRNDVFSKLLKLSRPFYDKSRSGDTYVRATEDISKVREYFGPAYMYTVNTISRMAFVITAMLLVS